MSKRPNPTLIGFFMLGTLVLAVAGLFIFSPKLFTSDTAVFNSAFRESVNGLSVGSIVKCQGVPIGEVTDIQLFIDVEEETFYVPVFYEIDMERLRAITGSRLPFERDEISLHIEKGLRAQLQMESIVTGQMYIELAYHEAPGPPQYLQGGLENLEIPTLFSPMAQLGTETSSLVSNLRSVNVNAISDNLTAFLINANNKLDDLDLAGLNASIMEAARSIDNLVNSDEVQTVVTSAPVLTEQLNATMADIQTLSQNIDEALGKLTTEVDATGEELRLTLQSVRGSVNDANALMSTDTGIGFHLQETLISLTDAADALRLLAESLEQNPDMLLRGRPETEQ